MVHKKTLTVGVINIKVFPHTTDRYVKLFKDLFDLGPQGKIRGSDWGMPGYLHEFIQEAPNEGLYGAFFRFLNIDPQRPWIDLKQRRPLETEEGEAIPQIPDNLKPNFKETLFVFLPQHHRFFFDAKSFSPNSAATLLQALFGHEAIKNEYGHVEVVVESSEEVIERILKIPSPDQIGDFHKPAQSRRHKWPEEKGAQPIEKPECHHPHRNDDIVEGIWH